MNTLSKPWFLRERLVFGVVMILSLTGLFTWFNVSEQEDPAFPYRNGFISIVAPSMSAQSIEDTIVQPLERALSAIDELGAIATEVADGVASLDLELYETVNDTDLAWQRIRDEVNQAKSQHVGLVTEFELEDRAQDSAGILFSIATDHSLLEARRYALLLRDELYKLPAIREIEVIGDPGEQIEVFYPQELMLELGISPLSIAEQIAEANTLENTGVIKGRYYQSNINPITRLDNVESLKNVDIKTSDGEVVSLGQIAQVSVKENPIVLESFWIDGTRRVGLSIILPPNTVRVVDFGEELMAVVEQLNRDNPDFRIETVFFQPEWTQQRRDGLALSLLFSCIGVGMILFLLMSSKLAMVVSMTIPTIALTALAFFGMLGGVLHQMSIAGLVISLGLMVDNSIVVSELIAKYRSKGLSALAASKQAMTELYKPLATSTLTTVAAFLPMLLASGSVADFIRMIPVIVILAILTSYAYALVLLPVITNNLKQFEEGRTATRFAQWGERLAKIGTSRPLVTIASFSVVLVLSFSLGGEESGEFFPQSSRNQAFIDIQGDYGLSHEATVATVRQVEAILNEFSEVQSVVSFVGNSGPRFYYNMTGAPNEPSVARIVFTTHSNKDIPAIVTTLNNRFATELKGTLVHAQQIGQGPPIDAPIEVRVLGDDRQRLLAASEAVFELIHTHPDTLNTRRGYIVGKPKLTFDVDANNLQKSGLTKPELSRYFAWRTMGIRATTLPTERESLEVILRDNQNIEMSDANYLLNTMLLNDQQQVLPMSLLASKTIQGESPLLTRRNGFNAKIVQADIVSSGDEAAILDTLMPQLVKLQDQYQVTLEFGGEAEEEQESNGALLTSLPIGLILLFSALIIHFNSFRVAGVVMLTIPLAMIGVNPMLSLAGVNFGFMSVLGVLALTGVVVNTAIILIDKVLTTLRTSDLDLKQAINYAVAERFRPVILTAATTIIGMIPLTSPESPLWPPLAWTMIGGLISSTILALVVLPAFLLIILNTEKIRQDH